MNSSTLSLYTDTKYDIHAARSGVEFLKAHQCRCALEFLDILGAQAQ